jgi:hypothetical protein
VLSAELIRLMISCSHDKLGTAGTWTDRSSHADSHGVYCSTDCNNETRREVQRKIDTASGLFWDQIWRHREKKIATNPEL